MLNHRVLVDRKDACRVTHAAAVEYLLVYLLAHAYVVGIVAVGELETLLAAFTLAAPALLAVWTVAILDRVGTIAMRTNDWLSM